MVDETDFDCPFDALKVIGRTNPKAMIEFDDHCKGWGSKMGYVLKSDTNAEWVTVE